MSPRSNRVSPGRKRTRSRSFTASRSTRVSTPKNRGCVSRLASRRATRSAPTGGGPSGARRRNGLFASFARSKNKARSSSSVSDGFVSDGKATAKEKRFANAATSPPDASADVLENVFSVDADHLATARRETSRFISVSDVSFFFVEEASRNIPSVFRAERSRSRAERSFAKRRSSSESVSHSSRKKASEASRKRARLFWVRGILPSSRAGFESRGRRRGCFLGTATRGGGRLSRRASGRRGEGVGGVEGASAEKKSSASESSESSEEDASGAFALGASLKKVVWVERRSSRLPLGVERTPSSEPRKLTDSVSVSASACSAPSILLVSPVTKPLRPSVLSSADASTSASNFAIVSPHFLNTSRNASASTRNNVAPSTPARTLVSHASDRGGRAKDRHASPNPSPTRNARFQTSESIAASESIVSGVVSFSLKKNAPATHAVACASPSATTQHASPKSVSRAIV